MVPAASDSSSFAEILRTVEEQRQTLTLYNFRGRDRTLRALSSFFDGQTVRLRHGETDDGWPQNFLVLHDDGNYVAASSLRSVFEVLRREAGLLAAENPGDYDYPAVLRHIDQTVFAGYGKARMVAVSRDVERTAWRTGAGELHAGFQRLSLFGEQRSNYRAIAEAGVNTHVYGVGDVDLPDVGPTVHPSADDEVRGYWFVVFRGEDGARSLLAEEREPGHFFGVWTGHEAVADAIVERLRERHQDDH